MLTAEQPKDKMNELKESLSLIDVAYSTIISLLEKHGSWFNRHQLITIKDKVTKNLEERREIG